jgi:hypothetical protein
MEISAELDDRDLFSGGGMFDRVDDTVFFCCEGRERTQRCRRRGGGKADRRNEVPA